MAKRKTISQARLDHLRSLRRQADRINDLLVELEKEAAEIVGDKSPYLDATTEYMCNGGTLTRYLKSVGIAVEEPMHDAS